MRHKCFISENDSYEFYGGGTHNDAEQVKLELKRDFGKEGEAYLDSVYGWVVRVRKDVKHKDFYNMRKRLHMEQLGAILYLFEFYKIKEIDFMPLGEFQSHCFVILSRDGAQSTEEVKVSQVKCENGMVFVRPFAEEGWVSCEFAGPVVTGTLDDLYENVYNYCVK